MNLKHVYLTLNIILMRTLAHELHYTEKEINEAINLQKVNYNSTIRL